MSEFVFIKNKKNTILVNELLPHPNPFSLLCITSQPELALDLWQNNKL